MKENIRFHFSGALADHHTLNFYEAARFQYAAARLIIKLAQFQETGRFSKRVTDRKNKDILLKAHREGSFEIDLLAEAVKAGAAAFISVPLTVLLTYVFERIFGKTSDDEILGVLNAQKDLVAKIGEIKANDNDAINNALEIIKNDQKIKEKMRVDERDLLQRRISELERERDLALYRGELSKIDDAREQKLISMSAPLISDMATPLRRSATSLQIVSKGATSKTLLYMDREIAQEIELARVDEEITPIMADIFQYNKDTGWGKARVDLGDGVLSFNVPSDKKDRLQDQLMDAMKVEEVFLQTYIVRDRAMAPCRLIVVGILPSPK